MDPQPLLATDARSLDALRRQAGQDPKAAVRAAAGQFESVFMRQMIKAMRDAVPKSGLWEGHAQSTFTDMFDQQMAQNLSGRPGGLAEVIARQLGRQLGVGAPAARPDAALGLETDGAAPDPIEAPGAAVPAASPMAMRPVGTTPVVREASPSQAVIRQALAAFAAAAPAEPTRASLTVGVPGVTPEAATPAARWTTAPGRVSSPAIPDVSQLNGTQAQFVRKVWPHALLAERNTGVPAAFIVGQAALESGWGRHEIRRADGSPSFNLFGIKASGAWQGDAVAANTTEYEGGRASRRVEKFRAYGSYGEAFQDWASMMARSPRYSRVIQSGGSVQAFAANMQRAGYATDPAYGSKLARTIEKTLALQRVVT